MAYPHDALAPHEELILNLHPHWWYIAKAGLVLAATTIFGLGVALRLDEDAAIGKIVYWLVGLAILVEVVWFAKRFLVWICTYFVLTSDRVMSRSGVLSKTGIEIPLERVNTVFFHQGIFERMLGLGDLEIESASRDGAQTFQDVRKPSQIQKEIYVQMESNSNRKMDRMGAVMTGAQQPAAAAGPSIPDQINQLASLRDQGHITAAEFETKKAELLSRM